MNYDEALDVLFTQLPMFQRQGPAAYKVDLDGTHRVLDMLSHPEEHLQVVHVAGTNGKGTVCHIVAASLQRSGYKVGLFTSPHLKDFRERIRVNGVPIAEAAVVQFVQQFEKPWQPLSPSFFELTFGMALKHFRDEAVDIVVLETGMGGRLDSTNVFASPLVTAITNVGLDHQHFLGQTVREIAREKAGIIKDRCPVVVGKMRPEALSVVHEYALRKAAEVHESRPLEELDGTAVLRENRATARAICRVLDSLPGWSVPASAVDAGCKEFASLTGQRGRFEWLPNAPSGARVLADCAHNVDGLQSLFQSLEDVDFQELHIVFGTVADKEMDGIWPVLPKAHYCWCAADIPRAKDAGVLAQEARAVGLEGSVHDSVAAALQHALQQAESGDLVLITGSIFAVAEALPSVRFTPE